MDRHCRVELLNDRNIAGDDALTLFVNSVDVGRDYLSIAMSRFSYEWKWNDTRKFFRYMDGD